MSICIDRGIERGIDHDRWTARYDERYKDLEIRQDVVSLYYILDFLDSREAFVAVQDLLGNVEHYCALCEVRDVFRWRLDDGLYDVFVSYIYNHYDAMTIVKFDI